MSYEVTCVKCELQQELNTVESIFDLQDNHYKQPGEDHFLELELIR